MRSSVSIPSISGSHTSSSTRSKLRALEPLEAFFAGGHGLDFVAFIAQQRAERLADAAFVVNDQNGCRHDVFLSRPSICVGSTNADGHIAGLRPLPADAWRRRHFGGGKRITNRAPVGRLSSTRIVPLCSAMIRLAIASPRPVPRSFGRKMRQEESFLIFGRNSVAAVGNLNFHGVSVASRRAWQRQLANRRAFHGLRRVVDQVRHHPPHQFRVGFHRGQIGLRSSVRKVMPSSRP